jgi:hypothetical protein
MLGPALSMYKQNIDFLRDIDNAVQHA